MKRSLTAFALTLNLIAFPVFANCGPWKMFKGNDYCVVCQDGHQKIHSCPGGEVGRVAVGVQRPNCSVSYWGPNCGASQFIPTEMSSDSDDQVKPGVATVKKEGDEYIIRMKEIDFNKLMTIEDRK